jgi:3-hydroxybutyryl-CoA dehydrogenase
MRQSLDAMSKRKFREIAVIGSGTMGPGIAQTFAQSYRVHVCDEREEALQRARSVIAANLETLSAHGLVPADEIPQIQSRIVFTSSLEDAARQADFVVECITEDPEAKRTLFSRLDAICSSESIFASNTSYLNIFRLVPEGRLPNTVITHWFAPPHILPLVEVARDERTSTQTMQDAVELLKDIGKKPVVFEKFLPGLAINRILRVIGKEMFALLENGYIKAEELDEAVKASIAPRMMLLGVVQRYDFTGLDLSVKNLQNDPIVDLPAEKEPHILLDLVRQGHLGAKTGKGFYDYHGRKFESILRERDDNLLKLLESVERIRVGEKRG